MIEALRLHWLRDGELPFYDTEAPFFHSLSLCGRDPQASWWERIWCPRRRIFLPLGLDISYVQLEANLRSWLQKLADSPQNGILIFTLRMATEIEPHGLWLCAGIGYVVEDFGEYDIPLEGTAPEDMILQFCRTDPQDWAAVPMFRRLYEQRLAYQISQERAIAVSKKLLETFLSSEQRAELATLSAFHVQGQDGRTYCIRNSSAHNVDLIENGSPKIRYCIVIDAPVPVYDLMLGQKLLLEQDLERFFRLANQTILAVPPG